MKISRMTEIGPLAPVGVVQVVTNVVGASNEVATPEMRPFVERDKPLGNDGAIDTIVDRCGTVNDGPSTVGDSVTSVFTANALVPDGYRIETQEICSDFVMVPPVESVRTTPGDGGGVGVASSTVTTPSPEICTLLDVC